MARNKRVSHAAAGDEEDVNLTPMLDVVFILLIFFIVTAQFIKAPGVTPQRANVENDASVHPLGILIAIDENDDIYMDREIVRIEELGFQVGELRQDNPQGKIVVQPDRDSRAETLIEVMRVLSEKEGLTGIEISTEKD